MRRTPMLSARATAVLVLALAVAACAAPPGASPSDQRPSERPSSPTEPAIDAPADGDPEELIGDLRRYASDHPDEFAGVYMHPPGSGSFVMLFTDRLDEHAAALAEISPRVAVREARYTEAELMAVMERIDLATLAGDGVEPLSASVDTMNNRVILELKSDDPTLELRLELEHGGILDVTVYPLPGPWANVESGDGWRLLAAGESGPEEAFTVRAATDENGWDELWSAVGLDADRPDVRLDDEVVVSFAHGIGSGCRELRLDDVVIEGGVVFSVTSDPLAPRGCTSDLAGAAVFVVALQRAALPGDGFTLQLGSERLTGPDSGTEEVIEVPLP